MRSIHCTSIHFRQKDAIFIELSIAHSPLSAALQWLDSEIQCGRAAIHRVGQKTDHFLMCMTAAYDEVGRRSIYQNVGFFIRSKTNIQNVAIFKHSWHKFGEKILRRKYQLI